MSNFRSSPAGLIHLTLPTTGLSFQARSCLPRHHSAPA